MVKLPRKTLPTKILPEKQGHSDTMYSHNNDLPHDKTAQGIDINNSTVGEHKENTQSSPTLPSQNGLNNIDNGNGTANIMAYKSKGKDEVLQSKHPSQNTPYFIPDPTNPDNFLGLMTKAKLDLFYESRQTYRHS